MMVSDEATGDPRTDIVIKTDESGVVRKGLIWVFGFLGLFLVWASLFPISSAVIASGQLVSNGQNKLVQHSSGGVIQSIEAKDGQSLQKGDIIAVLDDVDARARLTRLEARYQRLDALKSRLKAEKTDGADGGDTNFILAGSSLRGFIGSTNQASSSESIATTLQDEQRLELKHGRRRRLAEQNAAHARLDGMRARGTGIQDRLENRVAAASHTKRRIAKIRPLVKEGYVAKSKMWDLQEQLTTQESAIDDLLSEADVLQQQLAEGEADLQKMLAANSEVASRELTGTIGEMAEISDQIVAARNDVGLAVVRAPATGTLNNLQVNTIGGVVPAGSVIAAIVPAGAELIAEVKVSPKDIDSVHLGQDARIALSAFSRRIVDPVPAKVTYVAADAIVDQETGQPSFTVRVAFDLKNLPADLAPMLQSGMPADALIKSEQRVFLSYVLRPLLHSISRSFREPN